jgi:Acetyltransferase (isoleucine patch superfamily)
MGVYMANLSKVVMTKYLLKGFEVGDYTYGYPKILGRGDLKIGKFCSFAENITILLGVEHNSNWVTTYPFSSIFLEANHISGHPKSKGGIIIGNDVWIGQNATILSNLSIGNGAVIGACSVVTKDVEPYSIVAGNPAIHKKYRVPDEWIDALQKIKWWDWPIETILERIELLLQPPHDQLLPFMPPSTRYDDHLARKRKAKLPHVG